MSRAYERGSCMCQATWTIYCRGWTIPYWKMPIDLEISNKPYTVRAALMVATYLLDPSYFEWCKSQSYWCAIDVRQIFLICAQECPKSKFERRINILLICHEIVSKINHSSRNLVTSATMNASRSWYQCSICKQNCNESQWECLIPAVWIRYICNLQCN